jgi:hypothetical protein
MTNYTTPERTCPACLCRFSWHGRQWIIASPEGHLTMGATRSKEPMEAPKISRCPKCHAPLAQKATVTEVVDE